MRVADHRHITPANHRNRLTPLFIAGFAALSLTACGSPSGLATSDASSTPPPHPSAVPPSGKSVDPEAGEKKELMAAYSKYWAEQTKAYAKASLKGTRLTQYASGAALARAQADVATMRSAGTRSKGAPGHDVAVISLKVPGNPPVATMSDCLDISGWKAIEASSGKVLPNPAKQPNRYVTSVSAEKWGKRWMIIKVTPDGEQRC